MSIIYDALKKVEESSIKEIKPQVDASERNRRGLKTYLLYGLAACVGLFAVNVLFTFLSRPKQIVKVDRIDPAQVPKVPAPPAVQPRVPIQNQAPVQQPAQQTTPRASPVKMSSKGLLILNGIFFSENEGYALINNHIVKEGDTVNSAIVKRIGVDDVELEVDGENVSLTTAQR